MSQNKNVHFCVPLFQGHLGLREYKFATFYLLQDPVYYHQGDTVQLSCRVESHFDSCVWTHDQKSVSGGNRSVLKRFSLWRINIVRNTRQLNYINSANGTLNLMSVLQSVDRLCTCSTCENFDIYN